MMVRLELAATAVGLQVMGVTGHTALLGPAEPGFWAILTASPEWNDGAADPVDRWSARVIGDIAEALGAKPLFPFGPDAANFLKLAMDSDRCWQSPVGMLVQADAGLMISYRGALEFDTPLPTTNTENPCPPCDKPCQTACPVGAITANGYDVPTCHAFLRTDAGQDCMSRGCKVRRACPVSQSYARLPEQSAYHMGLFLK